MASVAKSHLLVNKLGTVRTPENNDMIFEEYT